MTFPRPGGRAAVDMSGRTERADVSWYQRMLRRYGPAVFDNEFRGRDYWPQYVGRALRGTRLPPLIERDEIVLPRSSADMVQSSFKPKRKL